MSATTTGLSAREYGAVGLIGLLMGVALSRIGFTSWDEVHRMFSFQDLRLVFVFMFAVVVLVAGWTLIKKVSQPRWTSRLFDKGTIPGGILFGIGWAVSGACPSIAMVSLGEGQLAAVVTLAGVFAGNWLYGVVQGRWLHWSTRSCLDD